MWKHVSSALLALLLCAPSPSAAFEEDVLASVVSVLPVWPGHLRGGEPGTPLGAAPADTEARGYLGVAYYRNGMLVDAIRELEAVVKAQPQSTVAYHNLALAYRAAGRTEDARTAWETALQIDGGFEPARKGLDSLGK